MKLGKAATAVLVAITLLAVGALAGQLRQPAPAVAADNSGAMLQQLKLMNSKLADQTVQLNKIRQDIGDYSTTGDSLRTQITETQRSIRNVCSAVAAIPDNNYIDCT